MFAMTGETQERRDHQLRRAAGARAFHRAADDFEAGGQIGAVDRVPFVAVTLRAIDQIGAGKFAIVRRGVGEMIVRRDEDERHLFHRGDIHSFMRRAGLHPAFADRR